MARRGRGFDTKAIHGAQFPDPATGARAVPIYQSTSFVFKDAEHAARVFGLEEPGQIYSRIGNPTVDVFEQRMALLEGGEAGLATASGMAAMTLAIMGLCRAGDTVISSSQLYGGSYNLLANTLPRYGIKTRFVDGSNLDEWERALAEEPNAKVCYIETPGNPRLNWVDVPQVAELAHARGLQVVVDSTFNTPYLFRPLDHGAHFVLHSATKFIGGHGTTIGGVLVGPVDFVLEQRAQLFRDIGPCLSPFNAFLLLLGLETLSLRMERHCQNALAVARFLEQHPAVAWVSYPGLESHPQHMLAQRLSPRGSGAVLSFGVHGGLEAGRKVINSVRLCSLLANIGDAKTLIIHPASTTHEPLTPDQQLAAGVTPDLIRLSVGIETVEDIIDDLDQALTQSQKG